MGSFLKYVKDNKRVPCGKFYPEAMCSQFGRKVYSAQERNIWIYENIHPEKSLVFHATLAINFFLNDPFLEEFVGA